MTVHQDQQAQPEQGTGATPQPNRKGQPPKGQAYHQPPTLDQMRRAFGKDLRREGAKTPVQGGRSLRQRWKNRKNEIFEHDRQHGTIEKYDKTGKRHLGEYDPLTGKQTKAPDRNKKPVEP